MELGRFMGSLHPVLIHFPIVLYLTAVLLEAVAFFRRDTRLAWTARLLLLLGTVSTLFAFVCGNFAHIWAARSGISQEALEYHEFLATVTSWLFVALTAWRILVDLENRRVQHGLWLAAASIACVMLVFTGYYGGELVYGHGAAVQDLGLRRMPTHEDLATLLERQDADSIFYSNLMHHIFGWMTLLLSLMLLLDQTAPRIGAKVRQFGPFLFLAGGLFLLIFSDQDAWPLYQRQPFRPITDKEVLLHKTYAVLMLLIGARGLWTLFRRKTLSALRGRGEPGAADTLQSGGWRVQDRLMAVFALVGGALLFTHVHSAAPYANVAVGVYIHHTIMGFIALCVGAVKLLDDALPTPSRRRALAFPALMAVEAVLLITYNEGLPWFLGYGRHSTVAAHGGLVAPLGPHRAELVYDPDTTRLDLHILRPDSAQPVPLPIQTVQAVVRVGEEATEVPLKANPGSSGGQHAHFSGTASFLRGLPLFQVQARVLIEGRNYVADFEPWVDKTLVKPTASFAYVCPMHPHVGAASPGKCALCAMPLQPNRPPRPPGQLHDPEFKLDLTRTPEHLNTRAPAHLTFTPRRASDNAVVPLEVVHEQRLHLIIVSRDLAFFDHVHPVLQANGSLALDYVFPSPGEFILYADLTPVGAANQVFRLPVTVAPPEKRPKVATPLRESVALARALGNYRVALTLSPRPLRANDEATLTFTLSEDGKPITNLEPLLGAGGHCVILSEDTQDYLHSHPLETPGQTVTGPEVHFHTRFPRSGLYKVWGQFLHRGKILTADFVVRVP